MATNVTPGLIDTASADAHRETNKNHVGIKLAPYDEVVSLTNQFMSVSNLRRDQFATNSWGYPFIPIPEVRDAYGRVRLAPKNVSKEFLGHPIYWVEPSLTCRLDHESEEQWCLRMFYLLDAMSYWDENVQWVSYLAAHEVELNDQDIKAYHLASNPEIQKVDHYPFLSEKDFENGWTLDDVDTFYLEAIAACGEIVEEESLQSIMTQAKYYALSQRIMGPSLYDPSGDFNDRTSLWRKKFIPRLNRLLVHYRDVEKNGRDSQYAIPELHKDAMSVMDDVIALMVMMNKAYAILKTAVDAHTLEVVNSSMMSMMLHKLSVLADSNNVMERAYQHLRSDMSQAFAQEPDSAVLKQCIRETQKEYRAAWRRLRLETVNYDRMIAGENIFVNYTSLTSRFLAQHTASDRKAMEEQRSRIESSLKDIDREL